LWLAIAFFAGLSLLSMVVLVLPEALGALTFLTPKLSSLAILWDRLPKLLQTLFYLGLPIMIALFLVVGVQTLYRLTPAELQDRNRSVRKTRVNKPTILSLMLLASIPFGLMAVLYMIGIIPAHAMTSQYAMFLTPFVALTTVALLANYGGNRLVFSLMGLAMVLIAVVTSVTTYRSLSMARFDPGIVNNAPLVLIDRIHQPVYFSLLDTEAMVFAASPPFLIEHTEDWLPRLTSEGGVYISSVMKNDREFDNNYENRDRIISQIESKACLSKAAEFDGPNKATISIYRIWKSDSFSC
jgi:hypothetical protein